jgi:Tfp pilus assembly protein PilE
MKYQHSHRYGGFTIVELMIATSVFSVVILLGLYAFMQVNRYYTKGINIVRTQEAARNLSMDIGNQFQLTNGTYKNEPTSGFLPNGYRIICVGNKAYVYNINLVESSTEHAIFSYEISANTCPAPTAGNNLTYLLRPGARILQLDINPYPGQSDGSGPLYDVTISLLYAPYEDSAVNSAGTDLVDTFGDANGNIDHITQWRCQAAVSGSEYCSVSKISTSVYKRVQ